MARQTWYLGPYSEYNLCLTASRVLAVNKLVLEGARCVPMVLLIGPSPHWRGLRYYLTRDL